MSAAQPDDAQPAAPADRTNEKPPKGDGQPHKKRKRLAVIGIILALAGVAYGVYWYVWSLSHEETDDAQVDGHINSIASQVSGYVAELCVTDNEHVTAGTVLVRIQTDDYEARVHLAEAQLANAEASLKAAEDNVKVLRQTTAAAIAQAQAGVHQAEATLEVRRRDAESAQARLAAAKVDLEQARANVKSAQADYDYASFNYHRLQSLNAEHQAAPDELRLTEAAYQSNEAKLSAAKEAVNAADAQVTVAQELAASAKAAIQVAQAAVEEQKGKLEERLAGPEQVRVAEAQAEVARSQVRAAQAQLDLARINLGYCTITAPVEGYVSRRSVEVGQFLQPGQPFMAVVPLDNSWVVANFKETQLRKMRIGHPAVLAVDAYPDHPFHGVVNSIAAGTGARFSILPPENATGNYVKVVQRVPVKLVLLPGQRDPQRPLRLGMNVVVTVDVGARPLTTNRAP